MKLFKIGMRLWISAASLFSFLTGWAFFAHSAKPAPLQFNPPAQAAPASGRSAQLFSRGSEFGSAPFFGQSSGSRFSGPRLRTGGS